MAQAAKKKPAPAQAQRKPAQASGSSKAAQAAAHQNRPAPEEPKGPPPQANVPATVRPQAPAVAAPSNLPAFMQADADLGKENISQRDMEIPRLKLMQGVSPELQVYDGLRAGDFLHPAAEFIFNEPFKIVPLFIDMQYILWKPRDMGGGILARTLDGMHWQPGKGEFTVQLDKKDGGHTVTWKVAPTVAESGLDKWGTMNPSDPNSPPAATQMYNYLVAFPEYPDLLPAVLSFQRTSIKKGRQFNTKLKTVRAPIFGTMWTVSSFLDNNGKGNEYYNIEVSGAGMVEDAGLYAMYKDYYHSMTKTGLSIKDLEGLQGEAELAETGGPDQPQGGEPRY